MGRWDAVSDRDYDDATDRWREIVPCARCGNDAPRHEGVSRNQSLCDTCHGLAMTAQIQKADRGVS